MPPSFAGDPDSMTARLPAAVLLALAVAGSASAQTGWNKKKDLPPPPAARAGAHHARDGALAAAVDGPARPAADRARDRYRHPSQTLGFWRVKPGDTVVDLQPGGGYWTAILAPYLRDTHGRYVAGGGPGGRDAFLAKWGDKARYGDVQYVAFNKASPAFVPAGTADVVISSREMHNWMRGGMLDKGMADAFAALKPGGVFAVEEHRADGSAVATDGSAGYVRTADVVAAAQKAGFRLDAASELNANKADTKDHPFGVWTLPPTRQSTADGKTADPSFQHAKYDAIGESDRMTLRFVKP